jgi:hypothetical protein
MFGINKIRIENIGCFEDLNIDLSSKDNFKKWALILGDNGVGKTTILRCIAMGLCDATSAGSLMKELYSDLIRNNSEGVSRITINLIDSDKPKIHYQIITRIQKTNSGNNQVVQVTEPKSGDFPWNRIFVCGYGAARRTFGTKDYDEYGITEAVYTLFNYDSQLQNPELVLRRLKDEKGIKQETILSWIDDVMMLPNGSSKLGPLGITVSGPWGDAMALRALGDGYQSIIAWIIDFLGWLFYFDGEALKKKPYGIIIIDEIEQHLHPKWQKQIIKLLSDGFPQIQFIASSHSPLCVVGTTSLIDENCTILVFQQQEGKVESLTTTPPRGKRVDQVLTSYLFDLYTTSDDSVKNDIEKYISLYDKKRSEKEDEDFEKLKIKLNEIIGSPENEDERLVENAVKVALNNLLTNEQIDKLNKNPLDPKNIEIKRQLNLLFNK